MNVRRLADIYQKNYVYDRYTNQLSLLREEVEPVAKFIGQQTPTDIEFSAAQTPQIAADDPQKAEKEKMYSDLGDRMSLALRKLYTVDPYLGVILGSLVINVVDPDSQEVPTMAVDAFGNIYVNPKWSMALSDDTFYSIFAHEAMHVVNGTFLRRGNRDPYLWNLVTDAVMNWALARDGYKFPPNVVMPDQSTGKIDLTKFGVPVTISVVDTTKNEILSCEEVYDQLEEWIEKAAKNPPEIWVMMPGEEGKEGEGEGAGRGRGPIIIVPKGTPGAQPMPKGMLPEEVEKAIRKAIDKINRETGFDKHLEDDEAKKINKDLENVDETNKGQITDKIERSRRDMIEKGKDMVEREEKERARRASNTTGGKEGKGNGGVRKVVMGSIPRNPPNWRAIIAKYMSAGQGSTRSWATLRRNMIAHGVPMPAKQRSPTKLAAIFALDTSGSVGDKELGAAIEYSYQMAKVATQLDVRIILWHHEAYWCSETLTSPNALKAVYSTIKKNVQPGGNGMENIEKLIKAKNLEPEVVIYITDGQEGYAPHFNKYVHKKYKKLFIIVSSYLNEYLPNIYGWLSATPPLGKNPTATQSEIVVTPVLQ